MLSICYFLVLSVNRKGDAVCVRWYKWQYGVLSFVGGLFGACIVVNYSEMEDLLLWRLLTWSSHLIYLCWIGDLSSHINYSGYCNISFLCQKHNFPIVSLPTSTPPPPEKEVLNFNVALKYGTGEEELENWELGFHVQSKVWPLSSSLNLPLV